MNLPFPSLTPKLVDSRWFNADNPCDEESEVALIEQKFQIWLTSVGQRYLNMNPLGKMAPEPMEEEAETDEEEGNDDSDDTEDTQDDEDDEEIVYAPGDDRAGVLFVPAPGNNRINPTPGNQAQVIGDGPAANNGAATGNEEAVAIAVVTGDSPSGPDRSSENNNDVVMSDSER